MSPSPARSALSPRMGWTIALALVSLALLPVSGWSSADLIRSTSGNQFDRPIYYSDQGDLVQFQHAGGGPHNVTSTQFSGGQRLFSSATIRSGTTAVNGTQFLAPGTYPFICTIHSPQMAAQLVVRPSAAPPPPPPPSRPDIEVAIRSRKLERVVNTGKLAVKVRALTVSNDVKLVATWNRRVLAKKANIDLAAGQVRELGLKLREKVRAALEDREKAKVKLTGTVPGGSPDVFARVLR
jgi:plastocyanin